MSQPQPELPIDPPAEREVELPECLLKAQKCQRQMESLGIELAEANLLTREEDEKWEALVDEFDPLLQAAEERANG
jgi:hypothetical protein